MARAATADDAAEAIDVVRKSILFLCVADHQNDHYTLDRWLANKTPESFLAWINDPQNFCVVEDVGGKIEGVGLLRNTGELLLFYIAPGHQRAGLGSHIHAALETHAVSWGLRQLHLESTAEARSFYQSLGYEPTGPGKLLFGVLQAYPHAKPLQPTNSFKSNALRGSA